MISFWRIFWLEWLSLVRSRTLPLLTAVSIVWMLVAPHVLRGDGTIAGAHEIYIRYSLGGVFALCLVSLLAAATSSLARERAAKRLQLTVIRPVRYVSVALGKWLAHLVVGALVLAVSAVLMALQLGVDAQCHHVYRPLMPTPEAEAAQMYDEYMKSPDTPAEIKRCSRREILSILTQRAVDHYQPVATHATANWQFAVSPKAGEEPKVRFRFTNGFELRDNLRGELRIGGFGTTVSNVTQAVLTLPLHALASPAQENLLAFTNRGKTSVMLRPRRDIELLLPADGFVFNLLRAWVELVSVLALVLAFGIMLSAALSRPVALFVAMVTLVVGEISPNVLDRYPYSIDASLADRVSLTITRAAAAITQPLASASPLTALSTDVCIELCELVKIALADAALMPALLALLAALAIRRKA